MLEFALIVPVLIVMLLGTIDLGLRFNYRQNLEEGVRDAARSAAVGDVGDNASCPTTGGSPGTEDTTKLVCLVKARTGLGAADTRVAIVLGDSGAVEGEPILICTQYDGGPVTGIVPFFGSGVVGARTVMRLETDITVVDYAETPLEDWSSCDF